jgi:Tol biopolymer transport system component
MEARPLQGTAAEKNDVTTPIFSPDGRWVAFYSFTDRRIKKVALSGGQAITICEADNPYGGSWTADNYLIIGQGSKGIIRVNANGGKPETIVSVNPGELAHQPQLLPGNDAVLFTLAPNAGIDRWDKAQIVLHSLKTGARQVLIERGSDARYVPTGHIVYAAGATLFAIPFDTRKLQVTGDALPVVEGVMRSANFSTGAAQFTFSNEGTLAYIPGDVAIGAAVLLLVDRAGARKPIETPPDAYVQPRISPTGKQLVVATGTGQERTVWIYDDLTGAVPRRKLTIGGKSTTPIFSKDGQRIVFRSDGDDGDSLYWQSADGRGAPERLLQPRQGGPTPEFFSDERTLIFSRGISGLRQRGLYSLSIGSREEPTPLIEDATSSSLSRDGNWLAYASSLAGRSEIYVQAFPITGTATRYQVTTEGADSPLWSPDGTELFYLSLGERRIYSVPVHTKPAFTLGKQTPLPIQGILAPGPRNYDITPDGKSFVTVFPRSLANGSDKAPFEQINMTLNWFEDLKQRVPVH